MVLSNTSSGNALLSIAKNYEESFGFKDQKRLEGSSGIVRIIEGMFGSSSFRGTYVDTIWSTNHALPRQNIINSIDEEFRDKSRILEGSEWCSYGGSNMCWYRYLVFQEEP